MLETACKFESCSGHHIRPCKSFDLQGFFISGSFISAVNSGSGLKLGDLKTSALLFGMPDTAADKRTYC